MNYIDKKLEEFDETFKPTDKFEFGKTRNEIKDFLKQALEEQREEIIETQNLFFNRIIEKTKQDKDQNTPIKKQIISLFKQLKKALQIINEKIK